MNDPITVAQLLTIPGIAAIVLLIVQYTKGWIPETFPTRVYALILAVVLAGAATALVGKYDATSIFLAVLNAIFGAAAAMGSYEATFAKSDAAKKLDGGGG